MISKETKIYSMDNSGVKMVKCIKVFKSSKKKKGYGGCYLLCVIRVVKPNMKLKKGQLIFCLITRTKKNKIRKDGSFIRFSQNNIISLTENLVPIATRSFGPYFLEIKKNKTLFKSSSIFNKGY